MPTPIPGPLPGNRTTKTFKDRGVTYEQRFVDCNKKNCSRCNGSRGAVLGHGPYWYFCVTIRSKWYRIYLGKDLDTARFRLKDGTIDWTTVHHRRKQRKRQPVTEDHTPPKGRRAGLEAAADDAPPTDAPPYNTCYVCGLDMDEAAHDPIPPAAYNLCGPCHKGNHQPEDAAAPLALPAPSGTTAGA